MAKKTFESALSRLEQITAELEEGRPTLEQSLKKFDEGIELVKFCNRQLDEARKKVNLLLKQNSTLATVDFDEGDDGNQDLSE